MGGCEYVNPGYIARDEFGDWNAPDTVKKAAIPAAQVCEQCVIDGLSLAFETVLSMPDKIDFIQRAKQAGYFVRLFFVGTDNPSINTKRVALRVMEGGHDVPISKIISRYTRSLANCSVAARIADRAYIYDNSVDNSPAQILFRTSGGALIKHYGEINPWAREILLEINPELSGIPSRE
jgi:predicted ABC-type ATPase